jgi:hypothetical protein
MSGAAARTIQKNARAARLFVAAIAVSAVCSQPLLAADAGIIAIAIKDHKFEPTEIHVPANKPALFAITNNDQSVEEFDSTALKVEKVVAPHDTGMVRVRPLAPGRYKFMGEFHSDTAQGVVVAE